LLLPHPHPGEADLDLDLRFVGTASEGFEDSSVFGLGRRLPEG
jgi:hypothetical protein